ncbi:MAG: histidinol-phosphatase [Alistipes sp.]|nr:histidinol-phosphatase [Alistipes sp.]
MKRFSIILLTLLVAVAPLYAQKNPDVRYLPKRPIHRAEMILPQVKGYNIYKADFHVHTIYSDGDVSAKGRVTEAYYDGLDIISITDHIEYRPYEQKMLRATRGYHKELPEAKNFRISHKAADKDGILADLNVPYEEAKKPGERLGMLVIPGVEITRHPDKIGHYNALFIKDANTIYDADPEQSIRNAKEQGALIMHNHPGWRRKTVDMNDFHKKIYEAGLIDGVEIVNGGSFGSKLIKRCIDHKLFMAAATDTHAITATAFSKRDYFRTCTFVLAKELTEKEVRKALEKNRTLAYAYDNVMGEKSLIEEFFHNSVSMKVAYVSSKGERTVVLTNTTSIPFTLRRGAKGAGSVLQPFHSASYKVAKGQDLKLAILNLWTADEDHPKGMNLQVKYTSKQLDK